MTHSICIENLKKIEIESEFQAVSLKKAAYYFLLPSLSIRLIFWPLSFYWKMRRYFKEASLANLSKCYSPDKEICRACLKRISAHEQEMISCLDARMLMVPLFGRLFASIKDTLEDRAESLILATDDQVAEVLPRLIDHFSQQDHSVSNWRRQLETLQ